MLRVHLVRHGECDWNRARRYVGRTDRPLTPRGLAQNAALAAWLRTAGVKSVVTSGLQRTGALAEELGLPAVEDARWREVDHGAWEGLTYRECQTQFGEEAVAARFADPRTVAPAEGETLDDLAARVAAAWRELTAQPSPVAVATHAGPIQVLLCQVIGLPLEQHWRWQIDAGSVTTLEVHGESVIVGRVNVVPEGRMKDEG
ncbi:MAG: histidine phosphatase family protein [Verrucomicrobia bacterium]|nr:histidine phosphatase family protein [Verrucomicrobiota bacterium]